MPGTITVTVPPLNLTGYATAGTIINRAAVQCGLGSRADPYDGLDDNFVQLTEFLTTLGDTLSISHDWSHLLNEGLFVTDGVTTSYTLPADFHDFVDQTAWDRTNMFPLTGPLSPQEAQYLKARLPNVLFTVGFRIQGHMLVCPLAPATGRTCVFEYESTYWVKSAGGVARDLAAPVSKDDVCVYEDLLLVLGTKLKFLEAKGFDTAITLRDYERALEHAIGQNTAAPVLTLSGGQQRYTNRFVNGENVPLTGFGT